MSEFLNVQVGEIHTFVMDGFREDQKWTWDAEIVKVSEKEIVCKIIVDQPRNAVVDRNTGIEINGKEYGWLEISK